MGAVELLLTMPNVRPLAWQAAMSSAASGVGCAVLAAVSSAFWRSVSVEAASFWTDGGCVAQYFEWVGFLFEFCCGGDAVLLKVLPECVCYGRCG